MITYDAWDREYLENKSEYLELFDKFMSQSNYENIEFFEEQFKEFTQREYIIGLTSATEALRFSLLALDIKPGDEILVTNFSWISTSSCISMVGATPVFCDIDLESYHISLESIERMYSEKTKALIFTPLFGNMTDCQPLLDFCQAKGIYFIEDSAQSFGSSLNGKQAGSFGECSSFSFNSNKVIAGINGGGVLMTNSEELAQQARLLRRHGKDDDFNSLGYNSKMYAFNAEILLLRLNKWKKNQENRKKIANIYNSRFESLPVKFQRSPEGLVNNYHKYTMRFHDQDTRNRIRQAIHGSVHYDKPLSANSMYNNISHRKDDCPNSQIIADTILSLPIHAWLTDSEVDEICNTIVKAFR